MGFQHVYMRDMRDPALHLSSFYSHLTQWLVSMRLIFIVIGLIIFFINYAFALEFGDQCRFLKPSGIWNSPTSGTSFNAWSSYLSAPNSSSASGLSGTFRNVGLGYYIGGSPTIHYDTRVGIICGIETTTPENRDTCVNNVNCYNQGRLACSSDSSHSYLFDWVNNYSRVIGCKSTVSSSSANVLYLKTGISLDSPIVKQAFGDFTLGYYRPASDKSLSLQAIAYLNLHCSSASPSGGLWSDCESALKAWYNWGYTLSPRFTGKISNPSNYRIIQ